MSFLSVSFVVEKEPIKCTFPSWMSSHHWHTLDGKMSAKMHHKNSTMHITDDNRRNSSGHPSSFSTHAGTFTGFGNSVIGGMSSTSLFTGGTRIVCQNSKDIISDRHVAIVAHHTEGWYGHKYLYNIYFCGFDWIEKVRQRK